MEALNDIKTWLQQQASRTSFNVLKPEAGRGQQLLFQGQNRADKVATAEKLAAETGKKLVRVDLSKLSGKYIGETEKNLRAVFDKAAGSDVILFFDEADALFGKRTNVKDAHDKYANQEVSYLLQKIEAFEGLVIISVLTKQSVDSPFLRRIRQVVEFG